MIQQLRRRLPPFANSRTAFTDLVVINVLFAAPGELFKNWTPFRPSERPAAPVPAHRQLSCTAHPGWKATTLDYHAIQGQRGPLLLQFHGLHFGRTPAIRLGRELPWPDTLLSSKGWVSSSLLRSSSVFYSDRNLVTPIWAACLLASTQTVSELHCCVWTHGIKLFSQVSCSFFLNLAVSCL